ncbi:MAG: hypothetical protein IJI84_03090 [Clostridia bacterium]|nr:hypothetical protein [Clostridia bacterium]
MKFKKVFFLWLFLVIVFSCAKTDAKMIKIQSKYLGFSPHNCKFSTEVFAPYEKEIESKLSLLNNSFNGFLGSSPDVVIVVDNDGFNEEEQDFLISYEKDLIESGMVFYGCNAYDMRYEFFIKLDKLEDMSRKSDLSELDVLNFIVSVYMKQFNNIFLSSNSNYKKYQYDFFLNYLNFDRSISAKCSANFLFLFGC